MATRNATVKQEYGEIGFGSSKRDGEFFEVTFVLEGKVQDRQVFRTEGRAQAAADAFNAGNFAIGQYGQVIVFII